MDSGLKIRFTKRIILRLRPSSLFFSWRATRRCGRREYRDIIFSYLNEADQDAATLFNANP